jgi:hypothetical protein
VITISDLEAADTALCEFEDARRAPCITAASWGLSLLKNFDRQGGFVSSVPIPSGASLADPPNYDAPLIGLTARPVGPRPADVSDRPAEAFPPDVSEPAGGILCVWCLIERAYQTKGQGSAPRTPRGGFVRTGSCARHSEPATLSREVVTVSPTVRRASAPAAERAPDGAPNPNAGVLPAFPRGRWS